MLLKGKNALVTGCNRGIGQAILQKFAEHGANVFAHARTKNLEFEENCKKLSNTYKVKIVPVYFDVTKDEEVKRGIKEIISQEKSIDILVNNVGAVNQVKLFQMTNIQEMREEFEIKNYDKKETGKYYQYFFLCRLRWKYRDVRICF